jgi:hypothetical protein
MILVLASREQWKALIPTGTEEKLHKLRQINIIDGSMRYKKIPTHQQTPRKLGKKCQKT